MTTYYVRKTGSDAAAGTSAGAAWLTIGKALGAAGIASGDTVYIGAGTYRETVAVAMTSATAETRVIADVDGAQTGDAGEVVWTAYTTNDTTAPAANNCCNLNGRDFLTFEKFVFVGGGAAVIGGTTTHSTNIVVRDCALIAMSANAGLGFTGIADTAANWTVERCVIVGGGLGFNITLPTSASADYDVVFLIQNCLFLGGGSTAVQVASSGAGSFKAGGVDVFNCTFLGKPTALTTTTANLSTSIPCTIYNCWMQTTSTAINANTSGQILEDYNIIAATTPRANVTAGTNSIASYPPAYASLLSFGQEFFQGKQARPFMTPMAGSPILGFGNQAGGPTVDFLNRPRPAGGADLDNAIGYLERHDTAVRETSTVRTGSNAIVITGPGDHDFQIDVDAVSTTISVYARYDSSHAATNKPQMKVLNGTECGVADATATMTSAADTWEQLSLNFTPTAKGIVTIRLISRSAAGGGKAFFDDFAVA